VRGLLATLVVVSACADPAPPALTPPPPSTGPFTDVTGHYGLDAPQAAFRSGIGTDCDTARFMTAAAAVGDVNGDGWPDVYLPRLGLPDRLLVNLGGRGFEDRAAAAGLDLEGDSGTSVLFDRDADGDLDLLVTSPTELPRLFDNDGAGAFTEVRGAGGIVVPGVEPGDCARMFGASVADVDGDGDLDVLTAAWTEADRSRLFRNDGAGRFEDMSAEVGLDLSQVALLSPACLDLDGAGDLDLAALADFDHTRIFEQGAGGRFVDVTATSTLARVHDAMGADLQDVDGDGAFDLFVTGICFSWNGRCLDATGWTGNHLFAPAGGATVDVTDAAGVRAAGWAWGSAFFDGDLDGDLDLVVTNGYEGFVELERTPTALFDNDGAGRFVDRAAEWGVQDELQGRAVVPFDFDGDGDEDLLVVNHADPPVLYRNDLAPADASLEVRVALPNNPFGVGAEVHLVDAAGQRRVRLVHGNSRFGGIPEPIARFGGVDRGAAYTLEVRVGGEMLGSRSLEPPLEPRAQVDLRP